MKVEILGGTGLLGKALVPAWSGDEVIGLSSRDVDIRDPQKVREVVNAIRPDWIVLAAAYTDVDGCESNPEIGRAHV
jgi:dTDP-4-dehydrorhamnose reductase